MRRPCSPLERQDEIATQALADEAVTAQLRAQQLEEKTLALEQEFAALKAEKTERGYVLTLGDVLFEVDRSSLKPGAQRDLYQLVTFLPATGEIAASLPASFSMLPRSGSSSFANP